MQFTAQQIAQYIGGTVDGCPEAAVSTFAKIEEATPGSLTFLANPKYTHFIYGTKATIVLVGNDFVAEQPIEATLIRVADPYSALARLLELASSAIRPAPTGIEQPCYIAEGVSVPQSCYVGAFAYIGRGVRIGENVKIYPQAYIGDGAAYAIGMAEMMHAGIRNDNILTVVINNGLFGMTGGQCAPTSLPGQVTTSTPHGKDPAKWGMPFQIEKAFSGLHIAYLARGSLADAKGIRISKKYIETAFEKHMAGEGFCLVELLSPCPTNMNMAPVKCVQRINEEMIPYFPLGELKK